MGIDYLPRGVEASVCNSVCRIDSDVFSLREGQSLTEYLAPSKKIAIVPLEFDSKTAWGLCSH